jgi:cytochrome c oxidase cbb3-type subunit 4
MTFQEASEFSRSWGLVFLMVIFGAALVYAFWPSNKSRFREAAQIPLQGDEE